MDSLYFDYEPNSLSRRMCRALGSESMRRITLPLDGLKVSPPPGLPKYHPLAMRHQMFHEFSHELNYIPPLAYYALHAVIPHFMSLSPFEHPLSSLVLAGTERINIVDALLPHAKHSMEHVDPPSWATLIQIFDGLPERYFRLTLALNDPYLSTLARIPSTPNFSLVTFLDLSRCNELQDGNIAFLKDLNSLCVLDTSGTALTDRGVKNLKSTLFLRELGPAYLRSWSLRECKGVTAKALPSFLLFPLLCVLDLRNTSILSSQVNSFWPRNNLLLALDNMCYFAPNPQHKIPELLQIMESSAFPHSENNSGARASYVVHIDRVRPRSIACQPSKRSNRTVHLAKNAYYVPTRLYDTSGLEQSRRFRYSTPYLMSEPACPLMYEYDDWDDADFSEDERSMYSEGSQSEDKGDSCGSISDESSLENSSVSSKGRDTSPEVCRATLPSSPLSAHTPMSSSSLIRGWDTSSRSPERPPAHQTPPEPIHITIPSTNLTDETGLPNPEPPLSTLDIFNGNTEAESRSREEFEPASSGFYNPRAEAGLAPPKRPCKRRRGYSSASSNYDSDEERKDKRVVFLTLGDTELCFLRKPPPWSTVQKMASAKQRSKNPTQGSASSGTVGLAQLANKRKDMTNGANETWRRILAASGQPALHDHPGLAADTANTARASPLSMSSKLSQTRDGSARRTLLGRAPQPPGTIRRRLK